MKEQKKGISLIVLVITIIVMLILASAVIITLSNSNIINKAKEAVNKTDVKNFEQELSLSLADMKLKDASYGLDEANAATIQDMKKYIPDFTDKYYGKLIVQDGKLAYVKGNVTEEEKLMFESIGIDAGSYITVSKAEEIKALAKATTIDATVSSTEVTTYIEDMPAEYAHLFTIFGGELYYRYEKATYDERVSLHAAGIPFLIGDANEDGILTEEDRTIIVDYSKSLDAPSYENFFYICDVDNSFGIDMSDGVCMSSILNGKILEYIDLEKQNLELVRFLGAYNKSNVTQVNNITTSNSQQISKESLLSVAEARRFTMYNGYTYYRYEMLTENERMWAVKYIIAYFVGDGNFDGYITEEDFNILKAIFEGETGYTKEQKDVLDMDGDGEITVTDMNTLRLILEATDAETYENIVQTYLENKANSL